MCACACGCVRASHIYHRGSQLHDLDITHYRCDSFVMQSPQHLVRLLHKTWHAARSVALAAAGVHRSKTRLLDTTGQDGQFQQACMQVPCCKNVCCCNGQHWLALSVVVLAASALRLRHGIGLDLALSFLLDCLHHRHGLNSMLLFPVSSAAHLQGFRTSDPLST